MLGEGGHLAFFIHLVIVQEHVPGTFEEQLASCFGTWDLSGHRAKSR